MKKSPKKSSGKKPSKRKEFKNMSERATDAEMQRIVSRK